ncbi:MAG TPA: hypothetical protein VGR52_09740 [Stellaceae bacterium]|nr:hypothetical protein [Stellaceae bacterium]HEV2263342.1 hypothetical protein [Stellaceae bacterium]
MRRLPICGALVGASLGLIAPSIWLYDFFRYQDVDVDRLAPFFPFCIMFLAIPYPNPGVAGIAIIAVAVILNALMYGIVPYFVLKAAVVIWARRTRVRS